MNTSRLPELIANTCLLSVAWEKKVSYKAMIEVK